MLDSQNLEPVHKAKRASLCWPASKFLEELAASGPVLTLIRSASLVSMSKLSTMQVRHLHLTLLEVPPASLRR